MRFRLIFAFQLGLASLATAQDRLSLTNSNQRISYALGMQIISVLKVDDFDLDLKAVKAGMADMQAGKPALTAEDKKIAMRDMQADILAKAVAKKEAAGEIHRKEGAAFLAANAKKEGIKIKEIIAPDGSKSELQYQLIKAAPPGSSPQSNDTVVVRYRGTFIDGTEFDLFHDAAKDGDPVSFKMNDVIPGWSAALQMMKPGDKWRLFIPPSLAYADFGPPEIGIHTTLIYELELISFSSPKEAALKPSDTGR